MAPDSATPPNSGDAPKDFERGFRFWVIISGLAITSLLAALEHTVVTTSAPRILTELHLGEDFIWITNAFFICSAVSQPLLGQFCNILGRRWIYLATVALFTLGSGICGGATSGSMPIAGRAVQGFGSGGIILMNNMIVSDLVPLRQRGYYVAIILAVFGVGTALGPFIGGAIVDSTSWRWVFYLNLPIGGLSLVVMFFFLHVKYDKEMSFVDKLKRIDYIGNCILMASSVAVLYALTYAGTVHPWSSWRTLVPFLLGFVGFFLFAAYEASPFVPERVLPVRLFVHRTSIIVLVNIFLSSVLYFWFLFFLPVYFQSVALYSPSRAGYSLLPQSIAGIPGAALAAIAISKWGKFVPVHFVGFAILTLGFGLLSLLSETTSIPEWAVYQIIGALGIGIVIDTLLPAFQAPVAEADQAAATSAWSYLRAFGSIWGVAIPAAIFNNRIDRCICGRRPAFLSSRTARDTAVYREALKRVFLIGVVFAGLATLLVLLEREVLLREALDTQYGLEEKKGGESDTPSKSNSDNATTDAV